MALARGAAPTEQSGGIDFFPGKSAIKSVYFRRMTLPIKGMATVKKKIKTFKRIHYLSFKIRQLALAIYKIPSNK